MKPGTNIGTQANNETENKSATLPATADQKQVLTKQQSQQNTLLAEGNVKKLFDESDMIIDWGALNPDSLWQRPESG